MSLKLLSTIPSSMHSHRNIAERVSFYFGVLGVDIKIEVSLQFVDHHRYQQLVGFVVGSKVDVECHLDVLAGILEELVLCPPLLSFVSAGA